MAKPGVRVLQEAITARSGYAPGVRTDAGEHDADYLVIALGADYDMDATPGLPEAREWVLLRGGAERLAAIIPTLSRGHAVIVACDAPFKCPSAPSECMGLLHDQLTTRLRSHRRSWSEAAIAPA
ncbi:MAG TPA: hypothetical protein VFH80_13680 [Solirubrobacteraceae bacterium]|nr:hypothetical protein [Solirubrobacteraceae bacterium]